MCAVTAVSLTACSGTSVTSTQSYKDGYYASQNERNNGFEPASTPAGSCSTLAIRAMVSGDNATQWEAGCVAGWTGGVAPN